MTAPIKDNHADSFTGFQPSGSTVCPQCDYDLTGLPVEHQCPECGSPYDLNTKVWQNTESKKERNKDCIIGGIFLALNLNCAINPAPSISNTILPLFNFLTSAFLVGAFVYSHWQGPKSHRIALTPSGIIQTSSTDRAEKRMFIQWSDVRIANLNPSRLQRMFFPTRLGKKFKINLYELEKCEHIDRRFLETVEHHRRLRINGEP